MIFSLLNPVDWGKLGIVIGLVAGISIVFALLIVIVNKLCFVKEDERIGKVRDNLAGANCGGCGYAGCDDYAKALCEGKATLKDCGATSNEGKAIISEVLGLEHCDEAETFAVVKCSGEKAKEKYNYIGNEDCVFQALAIKGQKVCSFSCLGLGTCLSRCPQGAITINNGVAVINKALCGGCASCVIKCPHHIIEIIPKSAKVYVACSSKCKGKEVLTACETGCIGCGICAKQCPNGAITMVDNLPNIDYSKCSGCKVCVSKCPRKTIREI